MKADGASGPTATLSSLELFIRWAATPPLFIHSQTVEDKVTNQSKNTKYPKVKGKPKRV